MLRGYWPDINNGEKPMDMALISSLTRADYLPPASPYAAGVRLQSYYYLGHLQTALLTDALFAAPRWTYNLMCATLPALCLSTLVSLCGALTGRVRNGIVAAILILCCGTLEPLRQWFATPGSAGRWPFGAEPLDYMATSRVIPFTINEYPWFTFNYGDLHAHFFAMPISILVICLAWALYGRTSEYSPQAKPQLMFVVWLCAFVLGALIVTNTWDFPMYWLLLVLCLPGVRRVKIPEVAAPLKGVTAINKSTSAQGIRRKGRKSATASAAVTELLRGT
jgi:uncharacterized membrane protein